MTIDDLLFRVDQYNSQQNTAKEHPKSNSDGNNDEDAVWEYFICAEEVI